MVHYNELGIDTYYGQNYFNCHSGTTYEVRAIFIAVEIDLVIQGEICSASFSYQ